LTAGGGAAISICPTSGDEIGRYPNQTPSQLDAALTRVQKGFDRWSIVDLSIRVTVLLNLAIELRKQANSMATMAANEMGKCNLPSLSLDPTNDGSFTTVSDPKSDKL
jgi:succinate-semialdehyde dehydrogenase